MALDPLAKNKEGRKELYNMSSISKLCKIALSLAIFAVVTMASATWARADTVTLNLNTGSTLPSQLYGTVIRDQIEHDGNAGVGVKILEHSFI